MRELDKYRSRPHWSASSIGCYMRCSLQYFFKYLSDYEPEFTPVNLVFGTAFHRACEHMAESRMNGRSASTEEVQECFKDTWADASKDTSIRFAKNEQSELADKGSEMVSVLARSWSEDEEVVAVSKAYCTPVLGADGEILTERPLLSEVDMIVRVDGREILVDWKSSRNRWANNKAEAELQPTVYLYSHAFAGGSATDFRFDVVTKAKTPVYQKCETTRTTDDMHRLAQLIRTVEAAITKEVFFPNHENKFGCGGCQFQSACKAWHSERSRNISQPALSMEAV